MIYQREKEYDLLHDEMKWRHMTYDPCSEKRIDFTWEREWRIKTDGLQITNRNSSIVVPNNQWADNLISDYDYWEEDKEESLFLSNLGFPLGSGTNHIRNDFYWKFLLLNELS